jgi:hypothetical protein
MHRSEGYLRTDAVRLFFLKGGSGSGVMVIPNATYTASLPSNDSNTAPPDP